LKAEIEKSTIIVGGDFHIISWWLNKETDRKSARIQTM
jgi:hypothetical protein